MIKNKNTNLLHFNLINIIRYGYYLLRYYLFLIYVYIYDIKKEKKDDLNEIFFEKWNKKLKEALKNPSFFNKNLDKEFNNIEETWKNTELSNKLESKWKSKILLSNTPLGNVYMYYDTYRLAFSYYSDNYIPITLLNAITIKYVLTNLCLDLFVEEKYLNGYDNKLLHGLKKYNEIIRDNKKILTSDVFIKKNKKKDEKKDKKKDEKKDEKKDFFNNKYVYKGKFYNIELLKKETIMPSSVIKSDIAKKLIEQEDTRFSYKQYKIDLKNKNK